MSYAQSNSGDLLARQRGSSPPCSPPAVNRPVAAVNDTASRLVFEAVQEIQKQTQDIKRETNKLSGGSRTDDGNRQLVDDARTSVKVATDAAQKVLDGITPRLKQDKLKGELNRVSIDFQNACNQFKTTNSNCEAAALSLDSQTSYSLEVGGSSARIMTRQQLLAQEVSECEVDVHTEIVNDFAEQTSRVAQNVVDLQRTMVSLADHAQSQWADIDNIESNMGRASEATQGATEQLTQASRHQQKNSKIICGLLLLAIIVAILLILVVSQRH